MGGQAWIVFADVSSATNAMKTMQNFPLFDKPIRVQYAKTTPDIIAKIEGTYFPRPHKRKHNSVLGNANEIHSSNERIENSTSIKKIENNNPPNKMLFVENLPNG